MLKKRPFTTVAAGRNASVRRSYFKRTEASNPPAQILARTLELDLVQSNALNHGIEITPDIDPIAPMCLRLLLNIHDGALILGLLHDALVNVRDSKRFSFSLVEFKNRLRDAVQRGDLLSCETTAFLAGLWEQLCDWQFHGAKAVNLTFGQEAV
jgi:hypothetical protein